MAILFKSTSALEKQIDHYLDAISEGMLVFTQAVTDYLSAEPDRFAERLDAIDGLEGRADRLRRAIEHSLYTHSLIPEHRGDVLGLLESMDDVIDIAKETLHRFSIEQPTVPARLHADYLELTATVTRAGEAVVLATRAFFKNLSAVNDHLHKVYFFETEADTVGRRLKREIFAATDLDLAHKMHLGSFTRHIDDIADEAEAVADRLTIYAIKRTI